VRRAEGWRVGWLATSDDQKNGSSEEWQRRENGETEGQKDGGLANDGAGVLNSGNAKFRTPELLNRLFWRRWILKKIKKDI